jgi:tetrahydromethanopterin S-methyltransferase subunit B
MAGKLTDAAYGFPVGSAVGCAMPISVGPKS